MIKLINILKEYLKSNLLLINTTGMTGNDWKNLELNKESIALNILYVPHKTGKIHLASKHSIIKA